MNKYQSEIPRRLEYAFIAVLCSLILLFLLFPDRPDSEQSLPEYYAPSLKIIEIPVTRQDQARRRPPPPKPGIPVEGGEVENIEDNRRFWRETLFTADSSSADFFTGAPLTFMPRQLIEVFPRNAPENVHGEVILLLNIGLDGKPTDHKLIRNSTGNEECVRASVEAAYKSTWQSAEANGRQVAYWIEKKYRFNLD